MAAEFVGTFALVFAGTGAIAANSASGGSVGHVGISATFGLAVMAMIYAVGPVSGAHFNPAVTIGFWAARRFPRRSVFPYLAAQFIAATVASLGLKAIFAKGTPLGLTALHGITPAGGFAVEVVITFFLMFVILTVATGSKEQGLMAGVSIGGTVALCALFAGPICGASMNPARSFGPALALGDWAGLWLYVLAPVAGALIAVIVHRFIYSNVEAPL